MIRPRKDEVAQVVQLLESGDFETPEQLAGELLKRVYRMFQERDWEVWAHRSEGESLVLLFGPFVGDREAEKLAARAALGGRNVIFKLCSPAAMERRLDDPEQINCKCGHSKLLHEHDKAQRCYFGHMEGPERRQRWVSDCDCKGYAA